MPAFAADYFRAKNIGPIYGLMLTAWGFASAFGPQLIVKLLGPGGSYKSGLHTIAIIMLVSAVLPIIVSPPTQMKSLQNQVLRWKDPPSTEQPLSQNPMRLQGIIHICCPLSGFRFVFVGSNGDRLGLRGIGRGHGHCCLHSPAA